MKIFILFLFCSMTVNSQYFEFDSMTIYSTKFEQNESKTMIYTNSKNDAYYLRLLSFSDSLEANLYDIKNKKNHFFKVTEVKTKDGVSTDFVYQKTIDLYESGTYSTSEYVYDFNTFEVNNNSKKVNLIVYKNSKRKKIVLNYELELKENNSNLFHAFRTSCLHPYEPETRLNPHENYIVTSAKSKTSSRETIEHKLLEYKQVDFTIQIP